VSRVRRNDSLRRPCGSWTVVLLAMAVRCAQSADGAKGGHDVPDASFATRRCDPRWVGQRLGYVVTANSRLPLLIFDRSTSSVLDVAPHASAITVS